MLMGCQGMGSWQECGCKFDFTLSFWVYVLKCESKMLVFFLIQCSFNCISILICNLSSHFDKQEPVSYGVAAVTFLNTLLFIIKHYCLHCVIPEVDACSDC